MQHALRILWRCILIAWFGLAFMELTTWLGSQPLEDLLPTELSKVPVSAKSFTTNHGMKLFHEHGTIQQEPLQFSLYVALLLVPWALLVWDLRRSGVLKRWLSRRKPTAS
jgi:hypothetical protein